MTEARPALRADFQRWYGLDLDDLTRGILSIPRAADLAAELPYGSQSWLAVGVDQAWSTEAHQLAFVNDALEWANWQRGGGQGERPTPMTRPARARAERDARDAKFKRLEAFEQRRKRREEARARQLNQP